MKKYILLSFLFFAGTGAFAQKFAYVDSEYIIGHVPAYQTAQKQLEATSAQMQKQVEAKFTEIDQMYKAYQADQVLLTDDMRKRRENDIIEKEKQAKEFQRGKFGPEGELFQQRTKLIKPIQDKISQTIAAYAKSKAIDVIFDKNSEASMMLYSNDNYDLSKEIVTMLGYKPTNKTK